MYISKTRFSNKNILFWIAIFHLLSSHITKKRNWRANNSGNLLTLYRLNNSITHWLPQRCPQDISSFGSKSTEPLVFYKSKDLSHLQIILFADGKISTQNFREFVRVENIRQDFILDLIAVFGTQSWRQIVGCEREQSWYSELSIHSSLDSNFCVEFPDVYSLIYKFFAQVKLSTSLACSWFFSAAFYFLTNILNRPLPGLRRKGRILKTFFLLILAEFFKNRRVVPVNSACCCCCCISMRFVIAAMLLILRKLGLMLLLLLIVLFIAINSVGVMLLLMLNV